LVGKVLGFFDVARQVDATVLVGAQLGYYGHWPLAQRLRLGFLWHIALPTLTSTLGYLPGRAGLGVDLPAGVADEWGRWCRSPNYLLDHEPEAAARFAALDRPTLFYSFSDDEFAPRGAVDALLRALTSAQIRHRRVRPAELGVDRIGHFGFFREHTGQPLWHEALDFVDSVLAGTQPPVAPHAWHLSESDIRADLAYGRD
jgi:predicted alpha/beta hydrolase